MNGYERPVWAGLTGLHEDLGEGGALARRYQPDINVFASARDDSAEALAALGDLFAPGETGYILQIPTVRLPDSLVARQRATGVQMRFSGGTIERPDAGDIVRLDDADAAEMLALAELTRPGPFLPRTYRMGEFWGVRLDGRLAAMAGERMCFEGHREVSGVCAHPDFRGRGLARCLSAHVIANMLDRGETPFLHAWVDNRPAIALYESLGFAIAAEVDVAVFERV